MSPKLLRVLLAAALVPTTFAASPERVDLCRVLDEPGKYAGKMVEVQGSVKPLMHGTYVNQDGCDRALLLVLAVEIPNYKGSVKVLRDAEFESFEKARFNYQPEAPKYSAVFVGQLEFAKRGKGFGYDKNHRVRLVLQAVRKGITDREAK